MEIITGYTGENHVTSADDASLYRGIFGAGDYVLDIGNKFAATIIDNNTIRIADGDLIIQGHQARIRANDYEEVTIDNGTPGEKRNDLIVARYQKNTTTGIESVTLEVVKGTPGATPTDPDITQEDLTTGGTQRDFVLYRVSLNGLALESVTSLFTVLPNLEALKSHLADYANLTSNGTAYEATLLNGWGGNLYYRKDGMGIVQIYGDLTPGKTSMGTTIAQFPTGYRPTGTHFPLVAHTTGGAGATTGLLLTTGGNLNIFKPATENLAETVRININFKP